MLFIPVNIFIIWPNLSSDVPNGSRIWGGLIWQASHLTIWSIEGSVLSTLNLHSSWMQMKGEKHIYFSSCVSSVQTSTQLQSMSDLCDKLARGLLITGKKSTFLWIFDYLCRKKLIWSAVPTLVDCPNPPQVHESKRRKLKRQRVVESSKDISRREESCAAAATPFQQSDADKSPQKKGWSCPTNAWEPRCVV